MMHIRYFNHSFIVLPFGQTDYACLELGLCATGFTKRWGCEPSAKGRGSFSEHFTVCSVLIPPFSFKLFDFELYFLLLSQNVSHTHICLCTNVSSTLSSTLSSIIIPSGISPYLLSVTEKWV